jgi:hypothetical protein
MNELEPTDDLPAKIPLAQIVRDSELRHEASWAKARNAHWPLGRPAAPDKPDVKVEMAWRVHQCLHHGEVDRDGMVLDFSPELLGEYNGVLGSRPRRGEKSEISGRYVLKLSLHSCKRADSAALALTRPQGCR